MRERSQIGFYGKLPNFGDFIGWRTSDRVWRRFFEYFDDGLNHFRRRTTEFENVFPILPQATILLYPRDDAMALMVLVGPSRDRVGRHYPFMAFATIVKKHWPRLFLPEVYRSFECNFWEAMKDCDGVTDIGDLSRELTHRMVAPSHSINAEETFRQWAGATTAHDWVAELSRGRANSDDLECKADYVRERIREAGRRAAGSAPAVWPLSADRRRIGMEISLWQIAFMQLTRSKVPPAALIWLFDPNVGGELQMFEEIPQCSILFDFWRTALNPRAHTADTTAVDKPKKRGLASDHSLIEQLLRGDECLLAEVLQL